jgi:hypothetical protein
LKLLQILNTRSPITAEKSNKLPEYTKPKQEYNYKITWNLHSAKTSALQSLSGT